MMQQDYNSWHEYRSMTSIGGFQITIIPNSFSTNCIIFNSGEFSNFIFSKKLLVKERIKYVGIYIL
jgi:hypothetical protein